MARKKLVECAFLIPLRRDANLSDGQPHEYEAWEWLEENLIQFGGATRDLALQEGWYPDPDTGERVTDRSRRYFVAMPKREVNRLRGLLREACRVFHQKCIYLSIAGQVEFVEGTPNETG